MSQGSNQTWSNGLSILEHQQICPVVCSSNSLKPMEYEEWKSKSKSEVEKCVEPSSKTYAMSNDLRELWRVEPSEDDAENSDPSETGQVHVEEVASTEEDEDSDPEQTEQEVPVSVSQHEVSAQTSQHNSARRCTQPEGPSAPYPHPVPPREVRRSVRI